MPNSNWRGAQYQRLGSHESVEMGMEGAGLPFFWGGGLNLRVSQQDKAKGRRRLRGPSHCVDDVNAVGQVLAITL